MQNPLIITNSVDFLNGLDFSCGCAIIVQSGTPVPFILQKEIIITTIDKIEEIANSDIGRLLDEFGPSNPIQQSIERIRALLQEGMNEKINLFDEFLAEE